MKNPKVILLAVLSLLSIVAFAVIAWTERKPKAGRPPKPEAGSPDQMEQARRAKKIKGEAIKAVESMAEKLHLKQPSTPQDIDDWVDDLNELQADCNRLINQYPEEKNKLETLIEGLNKNDYGSKENQENTDSSI